MIPQIEYYESILPQPTPQPSKIEKVNPQKFHERTRLIDNITCAVELECDIYKRLGLDSDYQASATEIIQTSGIKTQLKYHNILEYYSLMSEVFGFTVVVHPADKAQYESIIVTETAPTVQSQPEQPAEQETATEQQHQSEECVVEIPPESILLEARIIEDSVEDQLQLDINTEKVSFAIELPEPQDVCVSRLTSKRSRFVVTGKNNHQEYGLSRTNNITIRPIKEFQLCRPLRIYIGSTYEACVYTSIVLKTRTFKLCLAVKPTPSRPPEFGVSPAVRQNVTVTSSPD